MPILETVAGGSTKGFGTGRSSYSARLKTTYTNGSVSIGPTYSGGGSLNGIHTDGIDFYTVDTNSVLWRCSPTNGQWSVQGTVPAAPDNSPTIAIGNGIFIDGTGRYSKDKGRSWTTSPSAYIPNYLNVTFSNGYFFGSYVNFGASNFRTLISTDGINWTSYVQPNFLKATQYGLNGIWTGVNFFSGGTGPPAVWGYGTSPSPALQTTPSGNLPGNGFGVTSICVGPIGSAQEGIIVMGDVSSGGIWASTNHGATWANYGNIGFSPGVINYINSYFILTDYNAQGNIAYSTNGTSWTRVQNQLPITTNFYSSGSTNSFAKDSGYWMIKDFSNSIRTMIGNARV